MKGGNTMITNNLGLLLLTKHCKTVVLAVYSCIKH